MHHLYERVCYYGALVWRRSVQRTVDLTNPIEHISAISSGDLSNTPINVNHDCLNTKGIYDRVVGKGDKAPSADDDNQSASAAPFAVSTTSVCVTIRSLTEDIVQNELANRKRFSITRNLIIEIATVDSSASKLSELASAASGSCKGNSKAWKAIDAQLFEDARSVNRFPISNL